MLPFTVKEYVGLGSIARRNDDDRIVQALDAATAAKVVANLPGGWHTYPGGVVGSTLDGYWRLPRVLPVRSQPPKVALVANLEDTTEDAVDEESPLDTGTCLSEEKRKV